MGDFDDLPGVFYLAKVHRNCDTVLLTFDEYKVYLDIWNQLSESQQALCLKNSKQRVTC